MNLLAKFKAYIAPQTHPVHLQRGALGERAAKKHLQRIGLKFLTANFRSQRGEIDLIFRDREGSHDSILSKLIQATLYPGSHQMNQPMAGCLVFVEVKTRSSEDWSRPAAAVDARKRRLLSQTALDYLRLLNNPPVKIRFDIVEVLLTDGAVREIRHLPNTFALSYPYRYG